MNLRLGWNSNKALRRNVGVTLLEVLVSLLILSFGLLGVAGLQAVTASYKVNSWARNSAALLLSDFAERVRANPVAAKAPEVRTGVGNYEVKTEWSSTALVPNLGKEYCSDSCNSTQRAAHDLWDWRTRVRAEMPQGSVWVDGDRVEGFEVTLMWMDKGFTGTKGKKYTLDKSENCVANQTSVQESSCCPAAAKVVEGVRCQKFFFIP